MKNPTTTYYSPKFDETIKKTSYITGFHWEGGKGKFVPAKWTALDGTEWYIGDR